MKLKAHKQRYIHPFPARMAPDIALNAMKDLKAGEIVLDPMAGSGTVLHEAAMNGLTAIGYDLDPLAVLMTKIATRKINLNKVKKLHNEVSACVSKLKAGDVDLPWIDDDKETKDFIKYWFARKQITPLRKLAFVLHSLKVNQPRSVEVDVLRLALSRIIITKKIGASLAWDISHSRPHKMRETNDYDVLKGFDSSVITILKNLEIQTDIQITGKVSLSDARSLKSVPSNYVDKVITSPPYLNAIDYMRGHKFSLVWLGLSIPSLRSIRSAAVGAERKMSQKIEAPIIAKIYNTILKENSLSGKQQSMIMRYINDSLLLMQEISRVLKTDKKATLVVGNSTLNNCYIRNSQIFSEAGKVFGLVLKHTRKREIPLTSRYLPVPISNDSSLGKRMKHEMIMTFVNTKTHAKN
ncbi:MAG: hypothetical protein HYU70_07230 [Bacteroidetes bacterium]|nr:hypothetical protein [Bacteroidota bacterium]